MAKLLATALLLVAIALAVSCGGSGSSGGNGQGGGGGQCSGGPENPTCDFTECGGDVVGTWNLVDFCGPSCVVSVDSVKTYSSPADVNGVYCVQGDVMWIRLSTNCGPNQSTTLTVIRRRDCGAPTGGGGSALR